MHIKTESRRKTYGFDWSEADAMTDEERNAAIEADPDASVPADAQLKRARRIRVLPLVRRVRHELNLTRREFAEKFGVPLETIESWEREQSVPDAEAEAWLRSLGKASC
jgi:putative transcriptional regulator